MKTKRSHGNKLIKFESASELSHTLHQWCDEQRIPIKASTIDEFAQCKLWSYHGRWLAPSTVMNDLRSFARHDTDLLELYSGGLQ